MNIPGSEEEFEPGGSLIQVFLISFTEKYCLTMKFYGES